MMSGVRGSAWTAVAKDVMILAIMVFLGIYFPLHYYGGLGPMFAAIDAAKPGFVVLPEHGESAWWFSSTVLLTALGFYMWPHTFGSIYTARNTRVIRQNAVVLPLYQLILLFAFLVGFAAILQVPGLKGPDVDLALFKLSVKTFDPWIVGVIGAAGVLTALVPGSMILMTAATLLSNNVYRLAHRSAADHHIVRVAKLLVPVVALVAVYFTLAGGQTIVSLLLMGYSLVTQLFPALALSLTKSRSGDTRGRRRRDHCRRRCRRRHQSQPLDDRHAVSCVAGPGAGAQCRPDRACGKCRRAGCRQCRRGARDSAVACPFAFLTSRRLIGGHGWQTRFAEA